MKINNIRRRLNRFFRSTYNKVFLVAMVLLILWHRNRDRISDLYKRETHWYVPNDQFFKPTLYLKPIKTILNGHKFFSHQRKVITSFRLNGFKYCQNLDNSWFNGNVFIYKLNGTVMNVNPIRKIIVDMIDDLAKNITDFLYDRSTFGEQHITDVIIKYNVIGYSEIGLLFSCSRE